uniref:Uncharacterized protein n=1 Tax=Arundo donax TaxID=35708 RepID=A0A0A9TYV2_ARUDO
MITAAAGMLPPFISPPSWCGLRARERA